MIRNKGKSGFLASYGASGIVMTYEDINEWNRTKSYSRAYLDSDKDPILESDLMASGGITEESITEFFSVFQTSVRHFRRFIIKHDKS